MNDWVHNTSYNCLPVEQVHEVRDVATHARPSVQRAPPGDVCAAGVMFWRRPRRHSWLHLALTCWSTRQFAPSTDDVVFHDRPKPDRRGYISARHRLLLPLTLATPQTPGRWSVVLHLCWSTHPRIPLVSESAHPGSLPWEIFKVSSSINCFRLILPKKLTCLVLTTRW